MRILTFILLFCVVTVGVAQQTVGSMKTKTLVVRDSVFIDSVSINPNRFQLLDTTGKPIDTAFYNVDFSLAKITFSNTFLNTAANDTLKASYLPYPDFLTKRYFQLDKSIIVENNDDLNKLYQLNQQEKGVKTFTPFDGLNTSGSISRGIRVGNNQNTVLDSQLDLQISGQISPRVGLRASIQDSNIPLQEGGYSQNLDEFDQVFIELFSDNWSIRAGDVNLVQNESFFASFEKKVQGISLGATLNPEGNSTNLFAAGALVRGVFTESKFQGQEGNQGPYKLTGPNGELFVLIVSGSETVYVNGVPLVRGENKDYVIDYNAGEIMFNSTYPITSEMRISVQYQFSERNYTRIIATGGGNYESDNLKIGAFVYSENDSKNQPLQQNLNAQQVAILADAGDDMSQMFTSSVQPSEFSENRVLYRLETINNQPVYVFSTNAEDELFQIQFSNVGANNGDYILSDASAINRIYEYVAPVNGVSQGSFAPVIQLEAPTKLQIGVVNGRYKPSEKTNLYFEIAGSKNDLNLFSDIDDDDNDGVATKFDFRQRIVTNDSLWNLDAFGTFNYIQDEYQSIQRIYNIEFERDWNLQTPIGSQTYVIGGLELSNQKQGVVNYSFQQLDYEDNFSGSRHVFNSALTFGRLKTFVNSSYLNSEGSEIDSEFLRANINAVYGFKKSWIGAKYSAENNQQRQVATDSLTGDSQRFMNYEVYTGVGDSTNVFAEIGYRYRVNDSVQSNELTRVSNSNNYYLKSRLINTSNTKLAVFANYRVLEDETEDDNDDVSLNSRIVYSQFIANKKISLNTTFETNSGTLPQQEFTYVEVDTGEGQYTWNDYNNNGVQELEEFEIAQFQDEARFIRVLLPNQVFIRTHQNKFSQTLSLNLRSWEKETNGFKKFMSHFYNQTAYLIDRKIRRDGEAFDINPFNDNDEKELALNLSFRNSIFFNRGKQKYTTSYSYVSTKAKNLLSTGLQENIQQSHQINFNHKFAESWLISIENQLSTTESISQNFESRNFNIEGVSIDPKLSYLLSRQTRFDIFYNYNFQDNLIGGKEQLDQQKFGLGFSYANQQQFAISGEFNYIQNDFSGSAFSPVAYQMLEGLQPDKNYTWQFLTQKKLTKYLDLNLSYNGRKSENLDAIHTGSVQLRAYF